MPGQAGWWRVLMATILVAKHRSGGASLLVACQGNRGNNPAFTSDDFSQPDGPQINPTENVFSASCSSRRVFQNRMLSGNPSRSRGPGSSSRKKSASWASNDRRPLGTILMGWLSDAGAVGVSGVTGVFKPTKFEGGCLALGRSGTPRADGRARPLYTGAGRASIDS